ncbi:LacI family DNA-binding transcriptional regulator [Meridianimarinicoccus aquatilis]|uniref:LacI family transcriptional regulator n=1 Tax=Meridianimarinicoccus aquatilis TaxID=2552766 RepID=A0A4R6B5M2_9RHOB|nr:substrate-binding domain-containing protein [Fluviibacterium aquatile]TDL90963.1 LacI family transcriptional regulator [Fluviibacterium aquatile]
MNLRDLALELGLSQTTVSRALNGYPEVAEATRQRVSDAARRHNYKPNTRAKALATGRAMAIGHVIPLAAQTEMVNPVFADFIAGASETYMSNGYDIVLSVTKNEDEARVYLDMAAKRMVDGVIVQSPTADDPRIALLKKVGLPFVVHGRAADLPDDYSYIDVNNKRAFQRGTEFLVDLGHARIALINGRESLGFANRRKAGFIAGLKARGLTPDPALMLSDEMTEGYGYSAMRTLLSLAHPPTAFICSSAIIAFGMRRAADEAGLRLGQDISLITYDDDLSYFKNGDDEMIFTALRSSVRTAGRCAAEMLIDLINEPDIPRQRMMEAELIVGRSTGPARPNGTIYR